MSGIFTDAVSFWRMTISDALCIIHGVSERRMADTQMENIRSGNTLSMLVNLAPRKSGKLYKWTDFYSDIYKTEQTDEEIADRLMAYFGTIKEKFNGT